MNCKDCSLIEIEEQGGRDFYGGIGRKDNPYGRGNVKDFDINKYNAWKKGWDYELLQSQILILKGRVKELEKKYKNEKGKIDKLKKADYWWARSYKKHLKNL